MIKHIIWCFHYYIITISHVLIDATIIHAKTNHVFSNMPLEIDLF